MATAATASPTFPYICVSAAPARSIFNKATQMGGGGGGCKPSFNDVELPPSTSGSSPGQAEGGRPPPVVDPPVAPPAAALRPRANARSGSLCGKTSGEVACLRGRGQAPPEEPRPDSFVVVKSCCCCRGTDGGGGRRRGGERRRALTLRSDTSSRFVAGGAASVAEGGGGRWRAHAEGSCRSSPPAGLTRRGGSAG